MQADERFAAFHLLSTLIAVVDRDCRVQFVNAAFEDASGSPHTWWQGKDLSQRFVQAPQIQQAVQHASAADYDTLRFDAFMLTALGAEVSVHAIISQAHHPDCVVVELLPMATQARQARVEQQAQQSQANKELVRNLAHEIKNPLGGLRGAAQLLEMDLPDPHLREYTQIIIREADRLQALVDRMLAPHRSIQKREPVNIHEVCERVLSLVQAEFPQGLTIERDYDISLPELEGDKERLIQAVLNIVHNAAQAVAPQQEKGTGRITLRTRIAHQVTLGGQRHRLALELQIMDNGPGIAPELLEQVFYPLVTGKAQGTGLGLTLAQTYIQQHHGVIACESAPGRTVFTVVLPLSLPSSSAAVAG